MAATASVISGWAIATVIIISSFKLTLLWLTTSVIIIASFKLPLLRLSASVIIVPAVKCAAGFLRLRVWPLIARAIITIVIASVVVVAPVKIAAFFLWLTRLLITALPVRTAIAPVIVIASVEGATVSVIRLSTIVRIAAVAIKTGASTAGGAAIIIPVTKVAAGQVIVARGSIVATAETVSISPLIIALKLPGRKLPVIVMAHHRAIHPYFVPAIKITAR